MGSVLNGGVRMFYTRPSDNKTYCFQPVPLLAESKEILRTQAGDERLGVIHQLTFNGTLLPDNPSLSGVPDQSTCISLLDRKRDQLCDALSEDRGDLLVVDGSGYPIVSAKPLITNLSFDESRLVQQSPYQVTFEYENPAGSGYIREYSENWEFSQQENDTTSVSHEINAVGIANPVDGTTAIDNARSFIKVRLGLDKSQSHVVQTSFVPALLDVDNLSAFNKVLSESSDRTGGAYSVTETWVLSSGNFLDDRTIDVQWNLDERGNLVKTTSINGSVQGYGTTTFDKYENALNGFNTFVIPQLNFNASSGISSKSRSNNRLAGKVDYSITLTPSGSDDDLTNRSISRDFERQEDGSVVQSVSTSCRIRPGSASTIDDAISFCFANNFPIDSVNPIFNASLSGNLVSISTSRDDLSKSFSLNRSFTDQSTPLYREEYSIDREENLDSSQTQITVQGTVQGLGVESTTKGTTRFINASGAYFNTIEPLIPSRAAQVIPTGSCISDEPITKSLGVNPLAGTISYSQNFESRFKTDNVNIRREEIEITLRRRGQVIANIQIPGKSDGPILQDQETKTGLEKRLSITYSMKSNNKCGAGSAVNSNKLIDIGLAESDILVDNTPSMNSRGEKPESSKVFKTQDEVSFSRQSNEFSREITWQYV